MKIVSSRVKRGKRMLSLGGLLTVAVALLLGGALSQGANATAAATSSVGVAQPAQHQDHPNFSCEYKQSSHRYYCSYRYWDGHHWNWYRWWLHQYRPPHPAGSHNAYPNFSCAYSGHGHLYRCSYRYWNGHSWNWYFWWWNYDPPDWWVHPVRQ